MSVVYGGGLWSVFLITAVFCGYIWALNGPKWSYKALFLLALTVILASQFIGESHLFRVRVAEGLNWWKWAAMIAAPVLLYALAVRAIKKKVNAKNDS